MSVKKEPGIMIAKKHSPINPFDLSPSPPAASTNPFDPSPRPRGDEESATPRTIGLSDGLQTQSSLGSCSPPYKKNELSPRVLQKTPKREGSWSSAASADSLDGFDLKSRSDHRLQAPDGGAYAPGSDVAMSLLHHDVSPRNRSLLFMERAPPKSVGPLECRLLQGAHEILEFRHCKHDKCWLRARKKKSGLKRLAGSLSYDVRVPSSLMTRGKPPTEAVSFGEILREMSEAKRELDAEEEEDMRLSVRLGKLSGSAGAFRLWGNGLSSKYAYGAMDARPQFFSLAFGSRDHCRLLTHRPDGVVSRPSRKSETLEARNASGEDQGRIWVLLGTRSQLVWSFASLEHPEDAVLRVTLPGTTSTEPTERHVLATVRFTCVSPYVAMGVALAIASYTSSPLLRTAGSAQSLLKKSGSLLARSRGRSGTSGSMDNGSSAHKSEENEELS